MHIFLRLLRMAGVALLALGVTGVSAADVKFTTAVGGPADQTSNSSCNGNDVVTGFIYLSKDTLLVSLPTCQATKEGYVVGASYVAGIDSNDATRPQCPAGQAVVALKVWWDGSGNIHHFTATCRAMLPGVADTYITTATTGGTPAHSGITQCPSNYFATGIVGGWRMAPTQVFTNIGLKCVPLHDAGNFAGLPPLAVTNDQPALTVTNEDPPDNNGPPPKNNGPGNHGATRTAAQATTVYDSPEGNEIAYLDPGDAVGIVSCEDGGQGWCKISKPRKGYVWGGDLN